LTFEEGMVYSPTKRRYINASILCEMPHKKRNEGYEEHNHEEWQAGNSGDMSHMWDQNV